MLQDQLRQDSASLQRFVASIADLCNERSGAAAYLEPSERFFLYISTLASSTKKFLNKALEKPASASDLLQLRSSIRLIRAGWRFMHEFIKPVIDSHTLQLPTSLLAGLTARFREVPGFDKTDFVIYHTDRFNYLNVTLSVLKAGANRISSLVGGPDFPKDLGLIGIPYSQASSVFMNCLIPHEMGHYVFGESKLKRKLQISTERELFLRLSISNPQMVGLLVSWAEEIFCDLFAVKLVGFCFTLAFVELFDCGIILDENSSYSAERTTGQTEFSEYPPDTYRLSQQVVILDEDGWWNSLKDIDSHYVQALKASTEIKEAQYRVLNYFPSVDSAALLATFFAIVPKIFEAVEEITRGLIPRSRSWQDQDDAIALYLSHGIVPSTLRSTRTPVGPPTHPDPVCLLNSSYKFYILRLTELLKRIDPADLPSAQHRVAWSKKVEMWTAKAIEDVMLMPRRSP